MARVMASKSASTMLSAHKTLSAGRVGSLSSMMAPPAPPSLRLLDRPRAAARPGRSMMSVSASMNISGAVTKEYESCRLPEIADAPVTAIEGIGDVRGGALKALKINTVRDLGNWKHYK